MLHKYCVCNGRDPNCPYSASIANLGIHQLWTLCKTPYALGLVPSTLQVRVSPHSWHKLALSNGLSQRSHEKSCDIWYTLGDFLTTMSIPNFLFDLRIIWRDTLKNKTTTYMAYYHGVSIIAKIIADHFDLKIGKVDLSNSKWFLIVDEYDKKDCRYFQTLISEQAWSFLGKLKKISLSTVWWSAHQKKRRMGVRPSGRQATFTAASDLSSIKI